MKNIQFVLNPEKPVDEKFIEPVITLLLSKIMNLLCIRNLGESPEILSASLRIYDVSG